MQTRHNPARVYLTYHELEPQTASYDYSVSTSLFTQHLALAADVIRGSKNLSEPVFTFDDGYESGSLIAAAALEAVGLRGHFFLTTSWLNRRPGYMTWTQARDLVARGHAVGSHSYSHVFLTSCDAARLEQELKGSKIELEEKLGVAAHSISMPGGRYNRSVLSACHDAGYEVVFTSDLWSQRVVGELSVIGRVNVTGTTSTARLEKILAPSSPWARTYRARHAMQDALRVVIGDAAYHYVWAALAHAPRAEKWEGVE